jgi:uncharacterized protein YigE (DUF2233 family)
LLWVCNAEAQWTQRSSQTEPSTGPAVVHQHIVLEDASTGAGATLDLAKFSPKSARLQLIDNPERRDAADMLNAGNNVAGVNGGYFDENFAPLGLRVRDGKKLSPLVRGRLLTGIVVSSGPKTQILRLSEFSTREHAATAIQCGPFLIDHGAAVRGLDSNHTARRTFVAISGSSDVLIGYCSNASLAQLPAILTAASDSSRIQRALNLDGGSSSAFWFKRKDGSVFSIPEQKSVRDFIAIAPR